MTAAACIALTELGFSAQGEMAETTAHTETEQSAAASEPLSYSLGETVVTATRKREPLNKIPANVTVITAKELAARNVFSIREALGKEAGLYVSPTADVTGGVSLRGFSDKDILVMYNGQPLNSSFDGTVTWDSVPLDTVDRIEIVRGAGSSLYGGHAVAGVINIITKRAEKEGIHGDAVLSYGSNNTLKHGIQVTGGEGRLSFRAGYEKRTSDGWPGYFVSNKVNVSGAATATGALHRLSDGKYVVGSRGAKRRKNENVSLAFSYDFDAVRSISYSYMHHSYRYDYHNPFSYVIGAGGVPTFSGTVLTPTGYVQIRPSDYLGYLGQREQDVHRLSYEDAAHHLKLSIGYSDTYKAGYSSASASATSTSWTGAGARTEYPSQNYNIDLQRQWKFGPHSLLAGLAWMKDEMCYRNYNLSHWRDWGSTVGAATRVSGGSIASSALFIQDEWTLNPRWGLNLGMRFDQIDKRDGYAVVSGVRTNYPARTFRAWSPKVAVSYALQKDIMLYASFGKSFNPPSIFKLYRRAGSAMSSAVQANPDLIPETSCTYEVGIKHKINNKTTYGLTLFRVDTDDKIALATRGGVKAYYNMNTATTKGMELDIHHRVSRAWQTYFNYTFESGSLTEGGSTIRNWDLPRHMVHFGADYTYKKFNGVLDAQYVGARQKIDAATGEYGAEDAFFLTNFYLNYRPSSQAKIQLGIENLFNRKFFANEAAKERSYTLSINYSF